jgi:hypothetical protein
LAQVIERGRGQPTPGGDVNGHHVLDELRGEAYVVVRQVVSEPFGPTERPVREFCRTVVTTAEAARGEASVLVDQGPGPEMVDHDAALVLMPALVHERQRVWPCEALPPQALVHRQSSGRHLPLLAGRREVLAPVADQPSTGH